MAGIASYRVISPREQTNQQVFKLRPHYMIREGSGRLWGFTNSYNYYG